LRAQYLFNSINPAIEFEVFISECFNHYVFVTLLIKQLIQLLIQVVPLLAYPLIFLHHP